MAIRFLVEGEKSQAIGVIEVALPAGEDEEHDGAGHQDEAHEDLKG
jgi:hypothetical protein